MIFNRPKTLYTLIAAIVLQLIVLVMEYGNAIYPLIIGEEIKLKVMTIDPRSLFRGNYARLTYDIGRVSFSGASSEVRINEIVYVILKKNSHGIYEEDSVGLSKPDSGVFIRGRVERTNTNSAQIVDNISVRYGIEAFFAPKEKALDIENKSRAGGVAIVMLAENGKSALKDIVF